MSTPTNRVTRVNGNEKSVFPDALNLLTPSLSFNQGDLLCYDSVAKALKLPSVEGDGATFLGIAPVTVVNGKLASPYPGTAVDAAQAITAVPGPKYGVVAKLVSKTGDAWHPGDAAYLDPGDGVEYVSSAGTKQIGVYQGPVVASAVAGQKVEVLLGHRFPNDTLEGL